ncbi:hypothetical protein [Thermosynechococcus sp. FA-CM-4201]
MDVERKKQILRKTEETIDKIIAALIDLSSALEKLKEVVQFEQTESQKQEEIDVDEIPF